MLKDKESELIMNPRNLTCLEGLVHDLASWIVNPSDVNDELESATAELNSSGVSATNGMSSMYPNRHIPFDIKTA